MNKRLVVVLAVLVAVVAVVAGLLQGTPPHAAALTRAQSQSRALTRSQAQVNEHRAATFNMQYGNRWQTAILPLAKQVEVLALQEVRDEDPPDVEPADGTVVRRETRLQVSGTTYTVQRFRWVNCALQPWQGQYQYCVIYKMKTRGANRSLSLVVNQPADTVDAVNVIPPQATGSRLEPDAKPALGIRLTDGTWFYCVHARNRVGAAQTNDAPFLLDKIGQAAGDHWAAMGDFNRTPGSLPADPSGRRMVISSGQLTYPRRGPTSELDYMVARGIPVPHQYTAFRLRFVEESDHFPVGFWTSANPDGHDVLCEPGDQFLRQGTPRAVCTPGKPAVIVSMGDSYASGEAGRWAGNADTDPYGTVWGTDRAAIDCFSERSCEHDPDQVYGPTSYSASGNKCDRSDVAPITWAEYPGVDPWQHFNLACAGATTHEIGNPYDEKGERAQTDQLAYIADNYKVKLITVSIGGNDLGFREIVTDCAKRFIANEYSVIGHPVVKPYAYCKDAWPGMLDKIEEVGNRVDAAVSSIQKTMTKAGYQPEDYRLVVQSYPSPLPQAQDYRYPEAYDTRYGTGGCPFYDTDTDWARSVLVGALSTRLRKTATFTHTVFLDLQNAFAGHELCSKSAHQATAEDTADNPLYIRNAEWVRWIPYLRSKDFPWLSQGDQQEAIHPNAYGQEALGHCLTDLGGAMKWDRRATDFTCRVDPATGDLVLEKSAQG
ncbi:GDSL-type esterase/lipase family protein [Streptomyces sp. UNOC14_S4]|uniref:GDSL-type esterase/lipase family protein n=1 Tax=Streptomyces sp. UNOC14_S4 TaxID=2872340 RepID=UPI001E5E586F|nr:endonuclease/exonuclease/phosphatase family protein [Streptomyces sp. UNOC14_S4]MCC3772085.1 hypothetical protein [Streptomyces sp. UNOC14_S4]